MFAVAMAAVLISMAILIVHVFRSTRVFSRILGVNSFGTKTVLLISVWNFLIGRPEFLDLALIYAMMNFIGTIAVLRYSSPRRASLLEGSLDDPHGIDAVDEDDAAREATL